MNVMFLIQIGNFGKWKKLKLHSQSAVINSSWMCGSCHLDRASNFEICVECWNVYLLFFTPWSKRRTNPSAIFIMKSPNLFLTLKVLLNMFHSNIKKHNNKNHSIFNTNLNIWYPVQMAWSIQMTQSKVCRNYILFPK